MKTVFTTNLLRRTAAAFAAVAGFVFAGQVSAQSVTLTGATGNTCSYSSMSVLPNGNVSVACSGGGVTPPPAGQPGTYTLSGPTSLVVGTPAGFSANRVGGNTGDGNVSLAVTGPCTSSAASASFPNLGTTSVGFTVSGTAAGTCKVYFSGATGAGVLGTPSSLDVTVTAAPVTPPPGNGCPAVPTDVLDFDLKLSGADRLIMSSGRIGSAVLPGVKTNGGTGNSGQIIFGESTLAPRAATVEISVTKCRGVIDSAGGTCYLRSSNPTFTKLEWLERAAWGASTDAIATAYGLCKAYVADGAKFVNIRYTYSASDCSYGQCGFVSQWNYAGF
jgi:hypothetical protein